MRNNENGRSMVEMLGVLAIIGVLSAGGLAGYSKAMFKHKLNSTMDQITMLVTNIRTMYGTQGNYNGLDELAAYKLGIIPETMVATKTGSSSVTAVTLSSPFKGSVAIATSTTKSEGTAGTAFTVTYYGLPKEACLALATADFGSGAGSGYIGVNVGDVATAQYVGTGGNGRAEGASYTMGDAIDACTTESNTVSWKFY